MKKSKKKLIKKTKKKNNLRARTKFPEFKVNLNLKTRYEEISDIMQYANTLPNKEKKWLSEFVAEYINADFQHGGVIRHKTKRLKKSCYDKNNARNRDILTQAKAQGTAVVFSQLNDKEDNVDEMDVLIEKIDRKKSQ